MNCPAVSVIIPVYNAEPFFEKALHSLFKQTLTDLEYIFINDAAQDGSMTLLDRILSEYPHRKDQTRIITHRQNQGIGTTRKEGMQAAGGDYVIFCDSDDWIEPDMYEKMYQKAVSENADMLCCDYYIEYPNKQELFICSEAETMNKEALQDMTLEPKLSPVLWNKLIKRKLYIDNAIYPFEGISGPEDVGLTICLRYFACRTSILHEPLYHYSRMNIASITTSGSVKHIESCILCAKYIEDFFRDKPDFDAYKLLISRIKFMMKLRLLTNKKNRSIKRWKNLYPETHRDIRQFSVISRRECFFWSLAVFSPALFCFLFDIKYRS